MESKYLYKEYEYSGNNLISPLLTQASFSPGPEGGIFVSNDSGNTWVRKKEQLAWFDISISDDGRYQSAVTINSNGGLHKSNDFGNTWIKDPLPFLDTQVYSVQISSGGQYQIAAAWNFTGIFISNDYGQNWAIKNPSNTSNFQTWGSVRLSKDGKYQLAANRFFSLNSSTDSVYMSSNYGQTWSLSNLPVLNNTKWEDMALSKNGQYQLAANNNSLYRSNNFGQSWSIININSNFGITSLDINDDGQYQVLTENGNGRILLSNDYGQTWMDKSPELRWWNDVAINGNGNTIIAVGGPFQGNGVFISNNYGNTWNKIDDNTKLWRSVSIGNNQYITAVATENSALSSSSSSFPPSSSSSSFLSSSSSSSFSSSSSTSVLVSGCKDIYTVGLKTYNGPSRAVIFKGFGLTNNPNYGCECIDWDYTTSDCPALISQPNGIEKILDSNCLKTQSYLKELYLEDNVPHKYLVIPNCNKTSPNNRWKFSVDPGCCTQFYSVNFWSYNFPSRLVILVGDGLKNFPNIACDCITANKSCPILDNLPPEIDKVLDTTCALSSPFSEVIGIPKDTPSKLLVIPDCTFSGIRPGNIQARWKLTIDPSCDAGGCKPCAHVVNESCLIDYQFSINPSHHNTIFNTFEATTSYSNDQLNLIKVGINNGNRGYQRDIGYIIEETPVIRSMPLGVKGVNYRNIGGINFEYPSDTYINIRNNQNDIRLKEHESWTEDFNLFNKYSYTNLKTEEAGGIIATNTDSDYSNPSKTYDIQYKGYLTNLTPQAKYKQTVVIKQFPEVQTGVPVFYAFNSGWASYDVTSGMNFKNVFSYGIQVVDKLTFTNGFIIEGEKGITGANEIVSWVKSGLMPVLRTGIIGAFTALSAYCLEGPECPEPPDKCTKISFGGGGDGLGGLGGGKPCPIECWTGSNITGKDYYDWLTGTLAKYNDKKEFLNSNNVYGKIITGSIEAPFTILTGTIRYNNWISGDKFRFKMYPFDYTGLYRALHLGNDPIYPPYDVELVYPRDWTNIYNFVDKLNEKLNISKPIWYPYLCLSGTPTGYYADGPLMQFAINTGTCCLPTGDLDILDFQNLIDFKSLRLLPGIPKTGAVIKDEDLCLGEIKGEESGAARSPWYFNLKLDLAFGDRRGYNIYSGYSYLIPTCIEFQRWESGTWRTVDSHCNLYSQITGLSPTCITREVSGIVESEDGYLDQNYASSITGRNISEDDLLLELENATGQAGNYRVLLNFQQKITVNSKGKCEGWVDVKDIDFVWPENFPTGIITKGGKLSGVDNRYWCKPDEEEEKKKGSCDCPPLGPQPDCRFPPGSPERFGVRGGYGPACIAKIMVDDECKCKEWYCECPTTETPPVEICQIRTGWNLTGNFGLQAKSGNFDRYRIILSNFSGQNLEHYKPLEEFHIGNINLFSVTGIPLQPLTGVDKCPIGANYIIDVAGTVPLRITGIHYYSISGNMSGEYENYFEVVRPVLEEERPVKFNKVSGRIVSEYATGFWAKKLRPTGWACESFDDYFFYDRDNCEITFEKTLCAYVTGFTGLSGNFVALKQSVVNRELLVGGKFNSPIAFVTYTGAGWYTGFIENVVYKDYDVVGYYPISGYITGMSVSGRLQTSNIITGYGITNGNNYPYYPIPTGFISASGSIEIDYSQINDFDYFTLYGNNFVYHSNISEFPPPSFFNNTESLFEIISGVSSEINLISNLNNGVISLYSLRTGENGNSLITSTNSGAFKVFGMSGGKNIYPRLHNYYYVVNESGLISGIETLPILTGNIDSFILATGFYFSDSGTGRVTGNISTYTGVRYFTGVWDIATGNFSTPFESFLRNRWISGNSFIRNNSYNPNYLNYMNIRVFYLNQLSTFGYEEPDIVDFIVNDRNNPEISGSGVIFRLSGVK